MGTPARRPSPVSDFLAFTNLTNVENESENDQNDTNVVHTDDSEEKLRIVTSAKILKTKKRMILN